MVYLRYSLVDDLEPRVVMDRKTPRRFGDLDAAVAWVERKEEGSRYLIYSGTLFRKERGREINLIGFSRDERNDLRRMPLV
jgi:hypothetical protein